MEPGTAIGAYTVDKLLGEGAVGRVYRVRDRGGRPFAVKVLLHRGQDVRARFRQEIELQLTLAHPNLARGVELIEVAGDPALVMEYVDGVPLDQWLAARPSATLAERDRLARQLLDAVGFAHSRGLVHRDLKPANLLVGAVSDGPRLVVTDFGLAKGPTDTGSTRTGILLGSPRYVAPEQARDAKRVDQRADIWSIGAVLYEVYLGRPAFDQPTMLEVLGAVHAGKYRDPATFGAPARVREAIRGAMQVDPAARFPNCAAMSVALGLAGRDSFPGLGSPILPTTLLAPIAPAVSAAPTRRTVRPRRPPDPALILKVAPPVERVPERPSAPVRRGSSPWLWSMVLLMVMAWLVTALVAAIVVVARSLS